MEHKQVDTGATSAQYDGFCAGEIGTSVNLFRGEVAFDYPLVGNLPVQNGLEIRVSASYSSNIDKMSKEDNLTAPTGVMGLGWKFGYPAILRGSAEQILPPDRETFLYNGPDGLTRLYQTDHRQLLATLSETSRPELEKSAVSPALAQAFSEQGLVITQGAEIQSSHGDYVVNDSVEECELFICFKNGVYHVYQGGFTFENANYDFSRIVYYPRYERWSITQKNGMKQSFGGTSSAETLQWVVHYNGAIVPSGRKDGQMCAVLQWNLSKEQSVWNNEINYRYLQEKVPLGEGGLEYTRACYLSEVTDTQGYRVKLRYNDKLFTTDIKEYVDPEYPNGGNIAFSYHQNRFETKYLEEISTFSPSGKLLESIGLQYDVVHLSDGSAIQGANAKRLLTSVTRTLPKAGAMPSELFTYVTGQGANLGALDTVTTSVGTVIHYQYTQKQLPQCCSRGVTLSNENFTDKKVWCARNYAAVLLYNEGTSIFRIHSWVGRLQAWTPPEQPFSNVYQTAEAITTDNVVILYASSDIDNTTKVVCYRENPDILGAWTVEATELFASSKCSITAGDNWFAVNERDNGRLTLYTYRLLDRKTVKTVKALDATHAYSIVSCGDSFALMDYDIDGMLGRKSSELSVWSLDGFGKWSKSASKPLPALTALVDDISKTVAISVCLSGIMCAVAAAETTDDHAFYYDLHVLKRENTLPTLYQESISMNCGKNVWEAPPPVWQPIISGQIVVSGGTVLAFDGKELYKNTSLQMSGFDLNSGIILQAVDNDCVLQSRITDGEHKEIQAWALQYNPKCATQFQNAAPVLLHDERPEELKEGGYVPSICGETAVFDDKLYRLIGEHPFEQPTFNLAQCRSVSLINGGDFVAYSDLEDTTNFVRIVNGVVLHGNKLGGKLPEVSGGTTLFYTENDSDFTVYINTGDDFHVPVSNYQVESILVDDGFAKTGKRYVYEDESAVCDASGTSVRYYTVDVYNQYRKKIGFTRYHYCNSLATTLPTENATFPYATDGKLLDTIVYDEHLHQLSKTMFQYDFTRAVATDPESERERKIYGAVIASATSRTTQEGVSSTVYTEYDAFSGETRTVITKSCNVFGDNITVCRRSYAAAIDYPVLSYQNRISESGRTITEWKKNDDAPIVVESKSIVYRSFTNGNGNILVGSETMLWNGNGFSATENDAAWMTQSSIQKIDDFGNVVEHDFPIGTLQTIQYSADGLMNIGIGSSTANQPASLVICTFEPYENIPKEWKNYVTNETCLSGTSSLKIPAGVKIPPVTLHLEKGEYAAAFWCNGVAALAIDGEGVRICAQNLPEHNVNEYHISAFTVEEKGDVHFTFVNHSVYEAYVDLFSVSPTENPPVINVYKDNLLDMSVSGYREYTRYMHDRRNNVIATIDEKSAASLTIPFYKRLSEFHSLGTCHNAEMMIRFTGGSKYEPVAALNGMVLVPSTALNAPGTLGVYVDVKGEGKSSVTLDTVTIGFAQGKWTLVTPNGSKQLAGKSPDGEWLLLVGKRVYFFFNGELVFCEEGVQTCKTAAIMLMGDASFTNLLYGSGVSFGIRYLDSVGRIRQGQMFGDDGDVTVTQNFYDDENRLIAHTKPVVLNGIPFGYITDFAQLDYESGKMSGRVAQEYPQDEGFPYTAQRFENTPLGRLTESGLPGKAHAIDPNVPYAERQTVKLSYEPVKIPGLSLPDGQYHYITTTSLDGLRSVSVVNSEKQQVAVASLGKDSAIVSASTTEYHGAVRIEKDYLPAFFSGDSNAVRTKQYDFRGLLISKTDPNTKSATTYCYNISREQRFMQTPQLASSGKFIYQKYDELHRVIEEGACTDAWEFAERFVEESNYPSENIQVLRRYVYGKDLDDIGSFTNLIEVQIFEEDGTLSSTEKFSYDSAGRKIEKALEIPGVSTPFVTQCGYDIEDRIISTTSSAGKQLRYTYDTAGRMKSEQFSDGTPLTSFSYCANDMIKSTETDGEITKYEYTSTGWINKILSPLMEETIQYRGTKIEEFTVKLKVDAPDVPSSIRYVVTYDEFGRLFSALCYDGEKFLEDISVVSVSYDKNGNIQKQEMGGRLRNYLYQTGNDQLVGVDERDGFVYNADGSVTSSKSAGIEEICYENGRPVFFQTKAGDFKLTYDSCGNRQTKTTANNEKTVLLYNAQDRITEEIQLPKGTVRQYLYGQFGLRGIIDENGVQEVYTDHLGSPRAVGKRGEMLAAAHYTPFGKRIPIKGELKYGYNGYGTDPETGLCYSSNRLYDPEIGRFYSLDPKASAESPYVFCGNDPINRIDPNGDSWWSVLLGVVVGIIGVVATVATAGICLPAAMASESALIAETIVGVVAGAVGSVAGAVVTAACDKQPITGKLVIGSLVSGAVGGLGVLAGPMGQLAMRTMMKAGMSVGKITAAGIAVGCTVGAGAGVGASVAASTIMDMPLSGVSIAIAGLVGAGTGLLASRAYYGLISPGGKHKLLPVMIESNETGAIRNGALRPDLTLPHNGVEVNALQTFTNEFSNNKFYSFIDEPTFASVGSKMLNKGRNPFQVLNAPGAPGTENGAVIACHGYGRHCFVVAKYGTETVWRPIKGSTFVNYFTGNANYSAAGNADYIKLLICFSGCNQGSSSTAQKFANAFQKTVYATKGITYPTEMNQAYLSFTPTP